MRLLFVILLVGTALVASGSAVSDSEACGCMERCGAMAMMGGMKPMGVSHGMRGMMQEMMDDDHPHWRQVMGLGLDAKQKESVQGIRARVVKETIKKRAEKQIAEVELKELMSKDPLDLKAVESKLRQIEALRTDIHLSHVRAKEEITSILTPDQRKKMKEMMEMRPPMGGMMHEQDCPMCGMEMQHRHGSGMTEGHDCQECMMHGKEHDCPMSQGKPPMEHKH